MDRLKELKRGIATDEISVDIESDKVGLVSTTNARSNHNGGGKSGSDYMTEFFGDVEIVKNIIVEIKEAARRVSEINQNVLQATTNEKEQDISTELGPLIKTTNKRAGIAKQLLQRLREDTERLKTTNTTANSKNTSETRIRENLTNTLTRKFVDVMKEYTNAQTKYKTDIKKKVKRQVQIVKPDATTEEIDAVFKAGGGTGDVLKTAILKGDAADSIRNAYMNMADKYQDVLTLEKSFEELHQMFLDFALLTEKQGEMLDQIEHQVKEAADYIDAGNEEMVQAIEIQKSICRKQCCIALIVLIILGIIVGLVAAKVSGGLR